MAPIMLIRTPSPCLQLSIRENSWVKGLMGLCFEQCLLRVYISIPPTNATRRSTPATTPKTRASRRFIFESGTSWPGFPCSFLALSVLFVFPSVKVEETDNEWEYIVVGVAIVIRVVSPPETVVTRMDGEGTSNRERPDPSFCST
jgi:hypothetical protein